MRNNKVASHAGSPKSLERESGYGTIVFVMCPRVNPGHSGPTPIRVIALPGRSAVKCCVLFVRICMNKLNKIAALFAAVLAITSAGLSLLWFNRIL